MGNLFYFLMNFVLALFFLLVGIACLLVSFFPQMRIEILRLITDGTWIIFSAGAIFVLISCTIFFQLFLTSRRKSYVIRSGKNAVEVDQSLIEEYLNLYWRQVFPHHAIPTQVQIKKNQIYLTADLPFMPEEEQGTFLKQFEENISELFTRTLGYRNDFYLSINFQEKPKALPEK
ncbi:MULTISPECIES: hypothetical protein [Parachlamydia]|jgi:hypothetical protein|uniref:Alkaline shock response membrane anchor protein AmaP n=1 Tax=Parachlamydia acanthamoebae TaxID=83552 RepID=A0A0C1C8T4_9BACT|nr:hypothetical protein [Parachlamydia acanthamoebae]EFB42660.1 hypothetical protein pah_c004o198 [Parachlamydia acanthamoebae str. Hall's coccus]KIA77450.1 hypothetical protein DB43_GG00290 [Parachlamydia acanthamoebae]